MDEPKIDERMAALEVEMLEAEFKAIDALSRYKFVMFGYWSGIWVHLNRISGKKKPNPFRELVSKARAMSEGRAFDEAFPKSS